jgi:hypothetical protein
MGQPIRRVVTGHDDRGKATIFIDDHAPNATEIKGWPGLWVTELWVTDEMPVDNLRGVDQGARPMRHDPTPNGTIFRVVEFPPESTLKGSTPGSSSTCAILPTAADSAKHASMHKTRSIDNLGILADVVMDDGGGLLKAGDCVVQRGPITPVNRATVVPARRNPDRRRPAP